MRCGGASPGRLLCLLACLAWLPAADGAGIRRLASPVLAVEVMDPADPGRYNTGTRFTPLAAVLRVSRAGHTFLHAPEAHDPIDDHGGLASEFDLCIPGGPTTDLPSGFAEAAVGGGFLKIGVGVLQKGKEPYNLFQHPRVLLPAVTTATWEAAAARFHQTCAGVDGYAYELWADLTVVDDRIQVDWRLANRGTRAFTTRQYAHNFFRFDGRNVGPDYVLSFPYRIAVTGAAPEQEVAAQEIRFVREIPRWVNLEVAWPADYAGANTCVLSHLGNGLSVACATSLAGTRTAIHARPAYCAPEQFVAIALEPGADRAWSRSWTFSLGTPRP